MKLPKTLGQFGPILPLLKQEKALLSVALVAMICNAIFNLLAPYFVAKTIDSAIATSQFNLVLQYGGILLLIYLAALVAAYQQTMKMGSVGQRVLYGLRQTIFKKLQSLPVAFFQRHKAGDLISRINNDTDKLNQFLSESLTRLIGNLFVMFGSGIFMLSLHPKLALVALAPSVLLLVTALLNNWVKQQNAQSLKRVGAMSATIQENLSHFRVIVAFNRRDYFRQRFGQANLDNYAAAQKAGLANGIYTPFYDLIYHLAQLGVLIMGIYLLSQNSLSVGLLIAFFTYLNRFYEPMRQIAMLWASFQLAVASWERISEILNTQEQLPQLAAVSAVQADAPLMEFKAVDYAYHEGTRVLHQVSFQLEKGKTYAFVGPTGGGKSTTASLMARLYDPSSGQVYFQGNDLRSISAHERAQKIGFILQEPFLFEGSVRDNLLYGQNSCQGLDAEHLDERLKVGGLERLLSRFREGLDTPVTAGMSLGQQQLIAFMRAVLRQPALLILDEATANIDTITEKLLEDILQQLPIETTKVIIAHRLNTIENADAIFFVNAGEIIPAGNLNQALELLHAQQRVS